MSLIHNNRLDISTIFATLSSKDASNLAEFYESSDNLNQQDIEDFANHYNFDQEFVKQKFNDRFKNTSTKESEKRM